ncbi:UNVERIFIED_CONTAM: Bifunctional 3-dehydroquinate dehydratase/shikimate dehydrogenase, chloroplastic [Sesamum latifolium]|uniref:Bifunctional 3-dehydroquinate dehydratase/shikimate dehydrogenase, chloroplastic n=1 Tax=Sesamum latifolium TaxID=2727402 RepID=A0AAW2YF06_9LAMI
MLGDMHQAKMEGADVVEIRLDCISKFPASQRPQTPPSEKQSHFRLSSCRVASAFMKEDKLGQLNSSKIIVSCYLDSSSALQEDFRLVAEMLSMNADIIKFVSGAANITEIMNVFDLLSHSQEPQFGGLPSIDSLRQAYGVKDIDKNTVVFGLISKPVSHSKGPILHNPAFRHVCYNGIYVPMLVDDLKAFFTVYTSSDFAGFSVGIPYKEAVIDFCDEVHPLAQSIGAVNTIVRRSDDGKLIGHNTDCEAGITAIEDALKECTISEPLIPSPLTRKMFVLVGAGGAGRALAFGAKTRGARVVIFDIDFDRAKSLAAAVLGKALPFEDLIGFRPEKDAILANATPLGMHPNTDRIPVPEETLRGYKLVFDAVYTPRKTRLLKEAEAAGAIVVSGVEMFLRQAAAQFSLFTGHKAPEEFMRGIILEKF